MREQENLITNGEIIWPQGNKVEVGPDVDFVYIMRKDGKFAMSPVAEKVAIDYQLDENALAQTLLEEYDTFFAKLADTLKWGYKSKGNFELHLFDPNELDKEVRLKSNGLPIVSLDPLMNQGVYEFGVSRGYYQGGKTDFGQVARPESESLSTQAQIIAANLDGQPVSVSEDDIFSGGSVIASINALLSKGINIKQIISGIQVGKPKKLSEMGLDVDPVIEYQTTDGIDIFDKVDLGDPRDYLLGASGLVVKLPDGEFGRAPYILPFVSTTARAGIPAEIEKTFALKVLQANFEFFKTVHDKVGAPLLLKHMNHSFLVLMHEMYGVDSNTEMSQVAAWLMDNVDGFWETTKKQGELQEKLASLTLPQNIVFLDVNGTLFPDESIDGYIPAEDIHSLRQAVAKAKEKGFSVGLCSDSPLLQLKNVAEQLGVNGPILAENGNVLAHANQTLRLNALPSIDEYKEQINLVAADSGFKQTSDCVAPEFGGAPIDVQNLKWSFGANRETSITVFGPSQLIQQLGLHFSSNHERFSVDCSPEYNFFAIHPGNNYKKNKGHTLNTLSDYGHNIIMVGNSMSDWVEPDHGVICTFVSDAKINPDVAYNAGFISGKPVIKGIIDILENIK